MPAETDFGVYKILNTVNGKCYVGSAAKSLRKRKGQHWWADPANSKIQEERNRKIAESLRGKKLSQEHCEKIRLNARNISVETRQKMSESQKQLWQSETHRKKLSLAHIGKKTSEETKRKMSESQKRWRREQRENA